MSSHTRKTTRLDRRGGPAKRSEADDRRRQAGKRVSKQAGKQAGKKAGKPAASKQAACGCREEGAVGTP